ncbi:transposase [Enterococcus faecalis]|uniref:transposase n=2 Tax=Enterococcus TaxID=1350 RepID=UPI003B8A5749
MEQLRINQLLNSARVSCSYGDERRRPFLGAQIMAEIGDARRFSRLGALIAFAGGNPGVNQSSTYNQKSVRTSKSESAQPRKSLFQVMEVLVKNSPENDLAYAFLSKKREEGKPYYVYMIAGANKFCAIYYGRVNEYPAYFSEEEGLSFLSVR